MNHGILYNETRFYAIDTNNGIGRAQELRGQPNVPSGINACGTHKIFYAALQGKVGERFDTRVNISVTRRFIYNSFSKKKKKNDS
jgi:hypothetical protein